MATLFIIPARGGSKAIPGKNIKPLGGKPLICRAIDCARACASVGDDICLTTDSPEIIRVAEDYGLQVPFIRPAELATDTSGSYEVLLHAFGYYEAMGNRYDRIVLLQPTSPFRTPQQVQQAIDMYSPDCDMVVSVKVSDANPWFNLFEENADGFLAHCQGDGSYSRRQDCPTVYEYNGAVYVINPDSLRRSPLSRFTRCRKMVMDAITSIDLDTPLDWALAETVISQNLAK